MRWLKISLTILLATLITTASVSAGFFDFFTNPFKAKQDTQLGARTDNSWNTGSSGTYIYPINSWGLLLAASKYLNWGSTYGTSGYGLRDSSGTMQWKNSGGSWQDIGTGGGGGSGGSNWATTTAGVLYPFDYATRRVVTGGNSTTTNDFLQALDGFYANTAKIGTLAKWIYGTAGTLSGTTTIPWGDIANAPSFLTTESDPVWVAASSSYALITGSVASSTQAGHLVVDGTNCSAGNYPLGIDTYGNVQSCTAALTLSSFSASAPLSYNNGTGAFSISQASSTANGYLSSTDWTTFNNKQAAGSYLSTTTWGGIGGTLANQTDLQNALNAKQNSGSYALQATTMTAGTGLSGGGDLSTNRTFTLNMAGGTCSAGNHISALTATGTITCSADTGSGSGTPQDLYATSSPTFAGLTLTGFSGYIKASTGVFSSTTTIPWSDIVNAPSFFSATSSIDHNSLAGLQGGTSGQYYHLTSAQNTVVGNTSGTNTGDNATNSQYSSDYRAANFVAGTNYVATTTGNWLGTWQGYSPSGFTLANGAITGATKTKITYDSKGLVTSGADATTADISTSTDKLYITGAQQTVLNNTSGTNTGNETATSVAAIITGSSATTSIASAFEFPLYDTVASVLRKITWTNIKASLKTYFDTLYPAQSTTISAGLGLSGGGDLSTNRTITCATSSSSVFGCLASADFTTFTNKLSTTTWGGIGGTLANQTDLQSALNAKQATLVSGTNIKTVNNTTLLGSGDLGTITVPYGGTGTTTLTGLLKGNGASAFSVGANGTDYTLVTAQSCSAGNHISAITAAGTATCSADTGSGTPAGSDTWLQYNNNGAFGATSSLTFSSTTKNFYLDGNLGIGISTPNSPFQVANYINFKDTDFNTSIGYQAGLNLISGARFNTFLGYQAGVSSSTQSTFNDANTGIGYKSLQNNISGYYNSSVGYQSLQNNSTGINNTAIGTFSLLNNTTGSYNTSLGSGSLQSNTIGSYNFGIGNGSLQNNSTGNYNTAIGTFSLLNNTGSSSVALGYYAGAYETGSNSFYVNNQNQTNTAGDKANSLLYGLFGATASLQTLRINAATTTLAYSATASTSLNVDTNGDLTITPSGSDIFIGATRLGRDAHNLFDFTTDNKITFRVNNIDQLVFDSMGNIQFKSSIETNQTSSGLSTTMTVSTNAYGIGALLYISGTNSLSTASATSSSYMPALFMAMETGTGAGKKVLEQGFVRNDSWNWSVGVPVYVSTTTLGAPTTTQPLGTNSQIQIIGYTTATNTIYFVPNTHTLGL